MRRCVRALMNSRDPITHVADRFAHDEDDGRDINVADTNVVECNYADRGVDASISS